MKLSNRRVGTAVIAAGLLGALSAGCQKKEAATTGSASTTAPAAAPTATPAAMVDVTDAKNGFKLKLPSSHKASAGSYRVELGGDASLYVSSMALHTSVDDELKMSGDVKKILERQKGADGAENVVLNPTPSGKMQYVYKFLPAPNAVRVSCAGPPAQLAKLREICGSAEKVAK